MKGGCYFLIRVKAFAKSRGILILGFGRDVGRLRGRAAAALIRHFGLKHTEICHCHTTFSDKIRRHAHSRLPVVTTLYIGTLLHYEPNYRSRHTGLVVRTAALHRSRKPSQKTSWNTSRSRTTSCCTVSAGIMSGHFGDLMAPTTATPGLTTAAAAAPTELLRFSPLERLLVTANGNLQRIVSSYHAKPVDVRVAYNVETETSGVFHRQVTLHLDGADEPFCTATSKVTVNNDAMLLAIASNEIGIGQLFRHFDTLPVFTLVAVRRGVCTSPKELVENGSAAEITVPPLSAMDQIHPGKGPVGTGGPFWRLYQLKAAAGISCVILEQFQQGVLA